MYLVVAALGWSLTGVLIKGVDMAPVAIAFWRSLIATALLLPWARRASRQLDGGSLGMALAYAGTVIFLVMATKATSAANAIILQYTAPLYVFVLGIPILAEWPGRWEWFSLVWAMVGVGWIFAGAGEAEWMGIGLGLASGLSFGLLIILLRRYNRRDPHWVVFCNNALVVLLLLPWVGDGVVISGWELVIMLLMGTLLAFPYILFFRAIQRVSAREGAFISLLEPLLNPFWVAWFIGEIPGLFTQVGFALIFGGLVLHLLKRPPVNGPVRRAGQ